MPGRREEDRLKQCVAHGEYLGGSHYLRKEGVTDLPHCTEIEHPPCQTIFEDHYRIRAGVEEGTGCFERVVGFTIDQPPTQPS